MSAKQGVKNQATPAATEPETTWDEEKLEQAMQKLNHMHVRARLLRETIPKMLEPLLQKHPTPNAMFNAFTKAVTDAQGDVTAFTELMRDQESQEVFDYVKKSREQDPLGIRPWRHNEHPDWFSAGSKP